MSDLPGGPHLLVPALVELTWTGCFLISLAFGLYQVRAAQQYEAARARLNADGAAKLESRLLMRRALIRVVVSAAASGVGGWALLMPDREIQQSAWFTTGVFLVIAVGYMAPAVLEVLYARRQLRLLQQGKTKDG